MIHRVGILAWSVEPQGHFAAAPFQATDDMVALAHEAVIPLNSSGRLRHTLSLKDKERYGDDDKMRRGEMTHPEHRGARSTMAQRLQCGAGVRIRCGASLDVCMS